jgi:hypothetical protein
MATIKAPNQEYSGQIGDVAFKDGVAETENKAVIAYCRTAGYEVDGRVDNPAARPQLPENSSVTERLLGTPLRDAAVDPRRGDFLPPVNAGRADPHGPLVVSPEIHAAGATPLVPGEVSGDPLAQQAKESAATERALVDQEPAGPEQPAGNASTDAWRAYARQVEDDAEALAAIDGMQRDELREKYGN